MHKSRLFGFNPGSIKDDMEDGLSSKITLFVAGELDPNTPDQIHISEQYASTFTASLKKENSVYRSEFASMKLSIKDTLDSVKEQTKKIDSQNITIQNQERLMKIQADKIEAQAKDMRENYIRREDTSYKGAKL